MPSVKYVKFDTKTGGVVFSVRWLLCPVFGIFLVAGFIMLNPLTRPIQEMFSSNHWVQTPCTIVKSKIKDQQVATSSSSQRRLQENVQTRKLILDIKYTYKFAGHVYQGDQYSFARMTWSEMFSQSARQLANTFPAGSQQVCYVDPDNPARAVLNRNFVSQMVLGFFPFVFILVGSLGVLGTFIAQRWSHADNQGGVAGISQQIEAFVNQQPPRQLTGLIKRRAHRNQKTTGYIAGAIGVSVVLPNLGLFVVIMSNTATTRAGALVIGSMFGVAAVGFFLFAWKWIARINNLLRDGILTKGIVESIRSTGVKVNDQKKYRVKVTFPWNGQSRSSWEKVFEDTLAFVQYFHDNKLPIRLLVDPENPSRVCWVEGSLLPSPLSEGEVDQIAAHLLQLP